MGYIERPGAPRNFDTHAAEPDQAQGFPAQLRSRESGFLPFPGMNRGVRLRHRASESKHQRERMLRHADGIPAWRVHHEHAAVRRGVHIDVVNTNAGAPDNPKSRSMLKQR